MESRPPNNPLPSGVAINGSRLRTERQLLGDSLSSFASRVGITFQYLSQIERGDRRRVSPAVFARICDALGYPPHQRRALLAVDAA